jgi:hypothetical protein
MITAGSQMLSEKTLPGVFADSAGSEESDEAIAARGTMDGFVRT